MFDGENLIVDEEAEKFLKEVGKDNFQSSDLSEDDNVLNQISEEFVSQPTRSNVSDTSSNTRENISDCYEPDTVRHCDNVPPQINSSTDDFDLRIADSFLSLSNERSKTSTPNIFGEFPSMPYMEPLTSAESLDSQIMTDLPSIPSIDTPTSVDMHNSRVLSDLPSIPSPMSLSSVESYDHRSSSPSKMLMPTTANSVESYNPHLMTNAPSASSVQFSSTINMSLMRNSSEIPLTITTTAYLTDDRSTISITVSSPSLVRSYNRLVMSNLSSIPSVSSTSSIGSYNRHVLSDLPSMSSESSSTSRGSTPNSVNRNYFTLVGDLPTIEDFFPDIFSADNTNNTNQSSGNVFISEDANLIRELENTNNMSYNQMVRYATPLQRSHHKHHNWASGPFINTPINQPPYKNMDTVRVLAPTNVQSSNNFNNTPLPSRNESNFDHIPNDGRIFDNSDQTQRREPLNQNQNIQPIPPHSNASNELLKNVFMLYYEDERSQQYALTDQIINIIEQLQPPNEILPLRQSIRNVELISMEEFRAKRVLVNLIVKHLVDSKLINTPNITSAWNRKTYKALPHLANIYMTEPKQHEQTYEVPLKNYVHTFVKDNVENNQVLDEIFKDKDKVITDLKNNISTPFRDGNVQVDLQSSNDLTGILNWKRQPGDMTLDERILKSSKPIKFSNDSENSPLGVELEDIEPTLPPSDLVLEDLYGDLSPSDLPSTPTSAPVPQQHPEIPFRNKRNQVKLAKSRFKVMKKRAKHKLYTCEHCSYKTRIRREFYVHLDKVHSIKSWFCDICEYKTGDLRNFRLHIDRHSGEKRFKCDKCEYEGNDSSNLIYHMRRCHEAKTKFSCDVCDFSTNLQYEFNNHVKKHASTEYECGKCGKSFYSKIRLRAHNNNVHSGQQFICDYCDYKTKLKKNLTVHIMQHMNLKLYKCKKCNFRGYTNASINAHDKRVHKEKIHECSECSFKCGSEELLAWHRRIHKERPYQCPKCESCFYQKFHLNRHMLIHTDIKPFCCDRCEFKTKYLCHLKIHRKTRHTI